MTDKSDKWPLLIWMIGLTILVLGISWQQDKQSADLAIIKRVAEQFDEKGKP